MKQIIAMGGGGFTMEPGNPLLDQYLIDQTGKPRPKVCFLPNATDDAVRYVHDFYEAFTKFDTRPTYLSLFHPPKKDLEAFLLDQDLIYVGGGNTKSMLALWREWNLHTILPRVNAQGVLLAGISAGAICWFEQGITDSVPGGLSALTCLGMLPGSCCPHYDGETERRPGFHRLLAAGEVKPGIALDDGAAVHYIDGSLAHAVSSRPEARAYSLTLQDQAVNEQALDVVYLGKSG